MLARTLLGLALGKRLPTIDGDLAAPGLRGPVTIRRDKFGVPHIDATHDADGWFALGFCQGQDRAFQLESNLRVGRGTVAELVGLPGLGIDRLSRRIGFHRSAVEQLEVISTVATDTLVSFCAGINAAYTHGLPKKPHELAILGGELTPWTPADVLAFLKFTSFLLPGNWDVELARLRVLAADGPEALLALDPACQVVPGERMLVVEAFAAELADFQKVAPTGGGSNNFVLRGDRTASGLPLLGSDPHLAPMVPAPWYLAHLRTPNFAVAGATFAGTPTFSIGHNEVACWGITAGLTDNTDLWLEPLGPDGHPVGERRREVIAVKGAADHVEEVTVTPRGPVISPLLDGATVAISMQAVWLMRLPVDGFLGAQLANNFEDFRRPFAHWPGLPQNVLYADRTGATGYQLVGQLPRRRGSTGLFPMRPDAACWEDKLVPFEAMPHLVNLPYFATANCAPPVTPASRDVWLGADFVEHYRTTILMEELAARPVGWDVEDCRAVQKNLRSKPWGELRDLVLSLAPGDGDLNEALALLRDWDGHLRADSAAAAVFTLFLVDSTVEYARRVAPNSWPAMVGGDGEPPLGQNLYAERTTGPTVARLLATAPREAMRAGLAAVVRRLKTNHGPSAMWWQWGDLRPLHLTHTILGQHWLLKGAFNLPSVPVGGDANTVSQAAVRPLSPLDPTCNFANLRMVFDCSDWDETRHDLCGGQSGNPLSPHYDDLFHLRERGDAAKLAWTPDQVLKATKHTLRLTPGGSARS